MINDYWHGFCQGLYRNADSEFPLGPQARGDAGVQRASAVCKVRKLAENTTLEGVKASPTCCLCSSLTLSWKSRVTLGYLGLGQILSLLYALRICSVHAAHPWFLHLSLSTEMLVCYYFSRSLSKKAVLWLVQNKAELQFFKIFIWNASSGNSDSFWDFFLGQGIANNNL